MAEADVAAMVLYRDTLHLVSTVLTIVAAFTPAILISITIPAKNFIHLSQPCQ